MIKWDAKRVSEQNVIWENVFFSAEQNKMSIHQFLNTRVKNQCSAHFCTQYNNFSAGAKSILGKQFDMLKELFWHRVLRVGLLSNFWIVSLDNNNIYIRAKYFENVIILTFTTRHSNDAWRLLAVKVNSLLGMWCSLEYTQLMRKHWKVSENNFARRGLQPRSSISLLYGW